MKPSKRQSKPSVKKQNEAVNWQDLERLPVDVRRISAMSFSWDTLRKGCSSKVLAPICRDPEFWFQKFKQERLVLDQPIVKRWIRLWLGTSTQDQLLTNLAQDEDFWITLISRLIAAEYSATKTFQKEVLNPDPLVKLDQQIDQIDQELHLVTKELIELESVEENLNTAINIISRRKRRLQEKVSKPSLTNDYLAFNLPEWVQNAEEENSHQIKTYSDYLELIRKNDALSSGLYPFLEDIAIVQEFGDSQDPDEDFDDYLKDNPDKAKYYRDMAYQKATMIGLHLKTGDILNVEGRRYFVIRDHQKINLYRINGNYLPTEAVPILILHDVKTFDDIDQLYPDNRGLILDSRKFNFDDKNAPKHQIEGHTFHGYFEEAGRLPAKGKAKARAKLKAAAKIREETEEESD